MNIPGKSRSSNVLPDINTLFAGDKLLKDCFEAPLIETKQYASVEEAWSHDFLNLGGDMRRAINNVMSEIKYEQKS